MGPAFLALMVAAASVGTGLGSPVIHPPEEEQVVDLGKSVKFYCTGDQSVQWITNGAKVHTDGTGRNVSLTINRATASHIGMYKCVYTNNSSTEETSLRIYVKDSKNPWINQETFVFGDQGTDVLFPCTPSDPAVTDAYLVINGKRLEPPEATSFNRHQGITLHKVQLHHGGDYECEGVIYGKKRRSDPIELSVSVPRPPVLTMHTGGPLRLVGEEFEIRCESSSDDSAHVDWTHASKNVEITTTPNSRNGKWLLTSVLRIARVQTTDSGNFTCIAGNRGGTSSISASLEVLDRGFVHLSISEDRSLQVTLGENLQLAVHVEAYPKLTKWSWTHSSPESSDKSDLGILLQLSNYRYNSTLSLYRPMESEVGLYTFFAANLEANNSITFSLYNLPTSVSATLNDFNNSKEFHCVASGYPTPEITWHWCPGRKERCEKEEMLPLEGASTAVSFAQAESTLSVEELASNATYVCEASNIIGLSWDSVQTEVAERYIERRVPNALFNPVLATFGGMAALFLLLLIALFYKYKQKPKYETRWQIIEACEGNNYIFIDPTQLPYNEKLEFPRSNLTFGKTLGAGAFGKVLEATAHGLGKEDTSVKVAVKMLKPSAHTEEKEALMSELKIMSHLGQHNNIVNLLGACTHGGPILVITEYCEHGDLLNFLRKKGQSFVIQDPVIETLQDGSVLYKNICVDKKYTRSDSGFSSQCRESYIEMRPARADSTSKPETTLAEEGTEEVEDTKPLNLLDLLNFSSQVAQGMAFLASKNCIHRDVAARNVLVTHGRVAKICDFGLARDIMNDSNYVVKGNARLPVKWMAPESIFDCIYTMQSDVWSYGILLWELFSLGMSPYPGILVDGKFYKLVKQGYQMARPDITPLEIYDIMKACWDLEPTRRPTFQQISDYIQNHIGLCHDQDTNLSCNAEVDGDPGCGLSACDKECCEQGDTSQPLLRSNNYQFC